MDVWEETLWAFQLNFIQTQIYVTLNPADSFLLLPAPKYY